MDLKSDPHPGSLLVFYFEAPRLQEPFFFPTCPPPKDPCFLPIDSTCDHVPGRSHPSAVNTGMQRSLELGSNVINTESNYTTEHST